MSELEGIGVLILLICSIITVYVLFLAVTMGVRALKARPLWKRRRVPLFIRWRSFERAERKNTLRRHGA